MNKPLQVVPGQIRNGRLFRRPHILDADGRLVTSVEMGPAQGGSIVELNEIATTFAAGYALAEFVREIAAGKVPTATEAQELLAQLNLKG